MKSSSTSWKVLKKCCPDATDEECWRFDKAFGSEAAVRLEAYLQWRIEHNDHIQPSGSIDDAVDWERAISRALSQDSHAVGGTAQSREGGTSRARRSKRSKSSSQASQDCQGAEQNPPPLQPLYCTDLRDKKGHRIIHNLPARIDLLRASDEIYANAFALFLDRKFDRHSCEEITLVIDVRPGLGWPNPSAFHMVGFIRKVAHIVHDLHPSRLHRCILFPIPRPAVYLWNMVQAFLPSHVSQLMVLVPGSAGLESPPPKKHLNFHLESVTIDELERTRHDAFVR